MKVLKKQPSKLNELICVLFGHRWEEHGITTCHEHHETYNEYNICTRCSLENHEESKYCLFCYEKLFGKVR
jgi:hypothetical protein